MIISSMPSTLSSPIKKLRSSLIWAWADKTVITLTALNDLILDSFEVRKVLVIAPLRVARDTWPAEVTKWDHLKGLTYSVAVGTEKERIEALMKRTHIHIINRENVDWLINKSGIPFDYDMVVIDELSSFKSHQAKRFKSLLKVRPFVRRIVGLTGTPSSNGLMDLWAQFRILDCGKRPGRYITHYRAAYFLPDKRSAERVFTYKPADGAEQMIYDRISDMTISMRSADYLTLPECIINEVPVSMSEKERDIFPLYFLAIGTGKYTKGGYQVFVDGAFKGARVYRASGRRAVF